MADIALQGVSKAYAGHSVLQDLDLTVQHGECFTLLGPSGCGKTVLLRLIAGFENPDSGSIHIGGKEVSNSAHRVSVPPDQRNLGVVFQDYAVWPHMTVFNNVAYPLKIAKASLQELRERVTDSIRQVNLVGLEERLPSQLSGGQQQRVALARALVAKPSLMLLDEPLNNLDANLREEMRFEIKSLQRRLGITILYVTHDQEIALALSDRIGIMDKNGVIRQVGTPEEIFERPVDEYIFRFLGMTNFLNASIDANGIKVGEHSIPHARLAIPDDRKAGPVRMGFRPSDVMLSRGGEGIPGVVRRASFLGAMTDYLIEIDGQSLRTQIETHEALGRDLLFQDGESCRVALRSAHWFDA